MLSLGGSFSPFAFAMADAIFSRSSKRSSPRVWAHRLTSCSMSLGHFTAPRFIPICLNSSTSAAEKRVELPDRIMVTSSRINVVSLAA